MLSGKGPQTKGMSEMPGETAVKATLHGGWNKQPHLEAAYRTFFSQRTYLRTWRLCLVMMFSLVWLILRQLVRQGCTKQAWAAVVENFFITAPRLPVFLLLYIIPGLVNPGNIASWSILSNLWRLLLSGSDALLGFHFTGEAYAMLQRFGLDMIIEITWFPLVEQVRTGAAWDNTHFLVLAYAG